MKNKIGKNVKCSHCGNIWKCRSKAMWVSCTSCLQKTLNTTIGKVNKDELSLLIGDLDMTKKTTLKFVCNGKVLKTYPVKGFDKGQTNSIKEHLSRKENVPKEWISLEMD